MRVLAVLTVAFVFASMALFVEPTTAQSTLTLDGRVCAASQYYPFIEGGSSSSACQYAQGLPGANVTLTREGTLPLGPAPVGPSEATATTDANGDFHFEGLAAGDYTFTVGRVGFTGVSEDLSLQSSSRKDVQLEGQDVQASGTVIDSASSQPVANADVVACCDQDGEGRDSTGSDGRFSFTVKAGYYSISVQAPGYQAAYDSRLIDGAADLQLILVALPPQDAKITGTVRDQDGATVPDARVAVSNYGGCTYIEPMPAESDATDAKGASSSSDIAYPCYSVPYYGENYTFTDAQGRFTIGAYAGQSSLSVSKEGYAYVSHSVFAESGQTVTQDVKLLRFPEKTARIEGRIVDAATGKGIPNAYLTVQSPEYGIHECSSRDSDGSGTATGSGTTGSSGEGVAISIAPREPYDSSCAITLHDDGSFEGLVTPGYAILSVWVDWYSSCAETRDADGSTRSDCGPEYYSWSTSRSLAANDTTTIDVRVRARPAPDAEVSGYVLDAESGQAIPGAQISFSNQDSYGWGSATTDEDGSYRLRLRSGYHTVSVWAEGHLRWEGVVDIPKGDTPFDVTIVPGQESYGYCCYAYASDGVKSEAGYGVATASPAPMSAGDGDRASVEGSSAGSQYEDLGGGLGPYDASQRQNELSSPSDGAPGLGLLALLAALGAVFAVRRRLA